MAITLPNTKSTSNFEELDGNFIDLNPRLIRLKLPMLCLVGLSENITIVTDNINEGSTIILHRHKI